MYSHRPHFQNSRHLLSVLLLLYIPSAFAQDTWPAAGVKKSKIGIHTGSYYLISRGQNSTNSDSFSVGALALSFAYYPTSSTGIGAAYYTAFTKSLTTLMRGIDISLLWHPFAPATYTTIETKDLTLLIKPGLFFAIKPSLVFRQLDLGTTSPSLYGGAAGMVLGWRLSPQWLLDLESRALYMIGDKISLIQFEALLGLSWFI